MNKGIHVITPSDGAMAKLIQAREATAVQRHRAIKCPYCRKKAIVVFQDTRGHVQTKCRFCKKEVVFEVSSMN